LFLYDDASTTELCVDFSDFFFYPPPAISYAHFAVDFEDQFVPAIPQRLFVLSFRTPLPRAERARLAAQEQTHLGSDVCVNKG
jgi:hypothetical protein